MYYLSLFLTGIIGGALGGLLGIGGGIIFVLVLPISLQAVGVPQNELAQFTIANSLFATFFSSLSVNYTLIKDKKVYPRQVFTIGICAALTSLAVLKWVVNTTWYSPLIFNWVLIVMLSYMLARTFLLARRPDADTDPNSLTSKTLGFVGLISGFVSPLSGLGGGVVVIPLLNSWLRVSMKVANGISLGAIGIVSLSSTLFNLTAKTDFSYYNQGYIVFPIAIALSLGVMVGSPQGVKLSKKLPTHIISYTFAALMAVILFKKILEILSLSQ